MSQIVNCKSCGKDVAKTAPTCPHCGETAPGLAIKCPKCGSMSFNTGQKGFGLGKAAIGAIALGPIGLMGGMLGRKKIELTCMNCNHRWHPDPKEFA